MIGVGSEPLQIAITPDQAPVASFTVEAGVAGSPTSFNASASTVAYGSITSYRWNFGDGASAETGTSSTTHSYAAAGEYTVTLTETDSAGTSTTQVFTGQTMSRNGAASAETIHSVTVNAVPQVTTQPNSATVTAPAEASFAVACSGSPAPALQWQVSSDNGLSWSELPGQTSPTLAIAPTVPSLNGHEYRAKCTNVAGTAFSSAARLTVNPAQPPAGGSSGTGSGPSAGSGPGPDSAGDPAHTPAIRPSRVGIAGRSVTVTAGGYAVITLSCPAGAHGGCQGTVTLRLIKRRSRRARATDGRLLAGLPLARQRPLRGARGTEGQAASARLLARAQAARAARSRARELDRHQRLGRRNSH